MSSGTQVGITLTLNGAQEVAAGMQHVNQAVQQVGVSAAQTAAAMRNVPAQFTDIITSLQGGMDPLTVLVQQGGQLRDMFGGVGAAARALGGYVVGLINPFTVLAATAGAVAVAYYQGSAEADAFRRALITTGNAAGTSADQLAAMAQSMRDTGMTTGRAAEIMTAFAATGQVASYQMQHVNQAVQQVGVSAAQTAAAMRNVPAQFTDIITSLQGGMDPLTVLVQQGGQLRDMFGGVGAAARALGGYVVGLINPFTVLAATAGAVAVAYYQGSAEADAFRRALITTGNAAGTSADQLAAMAQSMRDTGMTTGRAAEIMTAFAATGQVASYQMQQFTTVAADMEKYVGQSLETTVKNFAELGKKPAEAAKKLTEEQHYLSAAIYEQIKALEKEGETLQAGQLAQSSYAEAMKKRADEVKKSLGTLESAWGSVGSWAKQAWDAMLDIGRPDSLEEKLAKTRERISKMQKPNAGFGIDATDIAAAQLEADTLQEAILRRNRSSSRQRMDQRDQDAAIQAIDEVTKIQEKGWSKQTQLNKALSDYRDNLDSIRAANPNSALLDPKKIAEGEKALREQYKESASAAENQITSLKVRIIAERMNLDILKERGTAAQNLNEGEKISIQIQQELKGRLDSRTRAQKEAALAQANILAGVLQEQEATRALAKWNDELSKRRVKEYEESVKADEKALEARKKLIDGVQQHVRKLSDEEEAITVAARNHLSLAAAVEQVGLARAQEAQDKALAAGADAATLLALQDEIEARKLLVYLLNSKDARDASRKAAEDAAKEWKQASEKIGDSITDALMRGFESGKDLGKSLIDTLKNMFKTLVLRPVIQAVINPISGALAGTMGVTQAAQAGQTSPAGGDVLSLAGAAQSAYSALSNGISSSIEAGFTRLMSSSFGESLGLAQPVGYTTGSGVQYGLSETGKSVGSALGMAGNALGGYAISKGLSGGYQVGSGKIVDAITLAASAYFGPIAGVAAAAFNRAFGRRLADTGVQGSFGGAEGFTGQNYQFYEGGWFRSDKTKTSELAPELQSGLATQFKTLQVSMGLMADTLGLSTDAVRDFTADVKISFKGLTEEQIQTKLQAEFTRIGDSMASAALATTEYTRTGETATQTLQRLSGSLTTVNGAFDVLGLTLYEASVRGGDMASQLIDLMGGMEKFQASTASYYQDYYTEAERNAVATRQMTESLSMLIPALPATREGFRALVEAQDLATESGRAAYAALMNLAPAFSEIVRYSEAAADAASQALADSLQSSMGAFQSLASRAAGYGNTSGLESYLQRLRGAFDAAGSLSDRVAILDSIASTESAIAAARQAGRQAEIDTLNARKSALQEQLSTANGVLSAAQGLRRYVADLRVSAASPASDAERMQTLAARYRMQTTLAAAGDTASLSSVQGTASAYLESVRAQAATSGEYALIFAKVAGELDALGATTEDAATRQIRLLQGQLDGIDRQVEALQSIQETSELTRALTEELLQQAADQLQHDLEAAALQLTATDNVAAAIAKLSPELAAILSSAISSLAAGMQPGAGGSGGGTGGSGGSGGSSSGGGLGGMSVGLSYATGPGGIGADQYYANIAAYTSQHDFSNPAEVVALASEAAQWGISMQDLVTATGSSYQEVKDLFAGIGLPEFAVGTNRVPRDMIAMIHEGEAIVPKAYNPAASAGGFGAAPNTERLERLVESLTAEVQRLQAVVSEGNYQARRAADAVNGRPEQPMPVETI